MSITFKKLSSLEKVFLSQEPSSESKFISSILKNEKYSFQIAYYSEGLDIYKYPNIKVMAENDFDGCVKIRSVGNVPSEFPTYIDCDDDHDYITKKPGLFPDPLFHIENNEIKVVLGQWRSVWVDFTPGENTAPGNYNVIIKFFVEDEEFGRVEHSIEVIDAMLPKQDLIHTEWFHYDCIGTYYRVEMLSEQHWVLIERYLKTAVDHGINMILTPLFTPPLDTKVGGERPTVQLIGVKVENGEYSFDFSKLKRFIDLCQRLGIEYFEMSHLFTQWGATSAPKIMATVDGVEKRIFGWETKSDGPEYSRFLDMFLNELVLKLKQWGINERCWFHVSDEPNMNHINSYTKAKEIIDKHLYDFKMLDALSDFDFYEKGLVKTPVPANNHIEPFLNAKIDGLWTYYCCGQYKNVSNRFFAMPSRRNRIIATQLYKYDIAGFLQWGYNFWYSQYSLKAVNPYCTTDAGCAFPSGDAFMVYPGEDGYPIESIRLNVFSEALYDLRAMKLLETLTSKDYVMNIIEEEGKSIISFSDYPRSTEYIINMRNKINEGIKQKNKR